MVYSRQHGDSQGCEARVGGFNRCDSDLGEHVINALVATAKVEEGICYSQNKNSER